VAHRFGAIKGHKLEGLTNEKGKWNGKVRLNVPALLEPLSWRQPQKVFVDSMSDLFHENLTDREIDKVFAIMRLGPHLTFQVLTKRADRMLKYTTDPETPHRVHLASQEFFPRVNSFPEIWPLPNVWLGVSVEDQTRADDRVPKLSHCAAALRFLSVEPLLGPVDLGRIVHFHEGYSPAEFQRDKMGRDWVDWVIVGGESGNRNRQCDVGWIRSIVVQCFMAGVPCWVKQLGSGISLHTENGRGRHYHDAGNFVCICKDTHGADPAEWPVDLRAQQFPTIATAPRDGEPTLFH
jgi:protein gp37